MPRKRERKEKRRTEIVRSLDFEWSEKVWGERQGAFAAITVTST